MTYQARGNDMRGWVSEQGSGRRVAFTHNLRDAEMIATALNGLDDLRHHRQWRAVGVDQTEDGTSFEPDVWQDTLEAAERDAKNFRVDARPPFDAVVIETRWTARPVVLDA